MDRRHRLIFALASAAVIAALAWYVVDPMDSSPPTDGITPPASQPAP